MTRNAVATLGFGYLRVFPFSARPGTAAARLDAGVAPAGAGRRAPRLRAVTARKRAEWRGRAIGRPVEVLAEPTGKGRSRERLRVPLAPPEPRLAGRPAAAEVLADRGEAVVAPAAGPAERCAGAGG